MTCAIRFGQNKIPRCCPRPTRRSKHTRGKPARSSQHPARAADAATKQRCLTERSPWSPRLRPPKNVSDNELPRSRSHPSQRPTDPSTTHAQRPRQAASVAILADATAEFARARGNEVIRDAARAIHNAARSRQDGDDTADLGSVLDSLCASLHADARPARAPRSMPRGPSPSPRPASLSTASIDAMLSIAAAASGPPP